MIETKDLGKQFGDFHAVSDMNLTIHPGEVMALLGQNGAGKTTTVRLLASILKPTSGWAKIDNRDVVEEAEKVRSSVGVLTEQHGLYLRMTGREYINFFGQIHGMDFNRRWKRCNELIEYFGLADCAQQPMGQYSKGMRQKIALARALLHEPPILLLDEPTSAMDPESAQLVHQAIVELRSTDRTILLCTHNLVEAEQLSDRIAIMIRGRIVIQGTIEEMKRELLGKPIFQVHARGDWRGKIHNLPKGVFLVSNDEPGPQFYIEDPYTINPGLIKHLIRSGVDIISIQEKPRTLEEIYLAAMAKEAVPDASFIKL